MIIITVRMEPETKDGPPPAPSDTSAPGVNVELDNTQINRSCLASLRPGESVEHRLRLDANGLIDLSVLGWSK